MIEIVPPVMINGTLRATLNGISFVRPDTPFRLADKYKVKGEYKLDFPSRPLNRPPRMDRSIINATYKGFIEVIFQNNDTVVQSVHIDGYSFFMVGYGSFLCLYCLSLTLQKALQEVDYLNAGWTLVSGQKKVEIIIISGMQFLAPLPRLVFFFFFLHVINSPGLGFFIVL